jgi:hypothetical protein
MSVVFDRILRENTGMRFGQPYAARLAAFLAAAAVLTLAGCSGGSHAQPQLQPPPSPSTAVPSFGHVFIVVGENAGFSSTYNSGAMPYLDSLAAQYGVATNYIADTHPSIGNYFVLSSGQILSNDDSLTPSSQTFSVDNIALDVQNAGETWKDYIETGSGCGALNSGTYYVRHDPLEYYSNINQANIDCFDQFAIDLQNGTLPNLSWLVPNGCDDGHDCPLGTFDSWLKTELGPLIASKYFQPGGDGLLIITFDENGDTGGSSCSTSQIESGTWCGGRVETVIVTPAIVSAGYQSTNEYHEENILRLMEEALGLTAFPGASSNPNGALSRPIDMADFFTSANGGTWSGSALSSTPSMESIATGSSAGYCACPQFPYPGFWFGSPCACDRLAWRLLSVRPSGGSKWKS